MGADVRIDNCSVTGGTISASSGMHVYAGGLAARLGGTNYVTNCYTDIDVAATSSKYVANAAGLVGHVRQQQLRRQLCRARRCHRQRQQPAV